VANDLTDASMQSALLGYWQAFEPRAIMAALPALFRRFSEDARRACERWSVKYPGEFEQHVLAGLAQSELLQHDALA
jgi:hypothetical protein